MASLIQPLTTINHDRDRAGLRHVYPVVSRRAGGVSIGINLNPNNACNWACIYCQVPELVRGGPPPLDLPLLERELNAMLDDLLLGDFMQRNVPPESRRIVDIAFSGNGEPTSAPEFAAAIGIVVRVMQTRGLADLKLRLITNGSLVGRRYVQEGLHLLREAGGEVWFKLDALDPARSFLINGVRQKPERVIARLRLCASLAPTWVQTCMMMIDEHAPPEVELSAYLALLAQVSGEVQGVLLYGLARPSLQPGAGRLSALPPAWLAALGQRIAGQGLLVQVND